MNGVGAGYSSVMNSYYAPSRVRPDASRLWAGGGATAVVAALAALVCILIARGLAHVAILAPQGEGAWGNASTVAYAIGSALVALVATGLLHFLLATTPRATQFFGWIMVLVTIVAVVIPLSLVVDTDNKVATALLNLVIGLVITSLLTNVAAMTVRRQPRQPTDLPPAEQQDVPPPTRRWDA
jgi:hypothetical protein